MSIQFNSISGDKFQLIQFRLTEEILVPDSLKEINPPDFLQQNFAYKGVVLSGRGPIWLYGFLVHHYHPTKWVATYDPRLQGAVVVASHDLEMEVGTIIPIPSEIFNEL